MWTWHKETTIAKAKSGPQYISRLHKGYAETALAKAKTGLQYISRSHKGVNLNEKTRMYNPAARFHSTGSKGTTFQKNKNQGSHVQLLRGQEVVSSTTICSQRFQLGVQAMTFFFFSSSRRCSSASFSAHALSLATAAILRSTLLITFFLFASCNCAFRFLASACASLRFKGKALH